MRKPSVQCGLLAATVAKHRWGTPVGRESLPSVAAIEGNEYPAARNVFDQLRREPFVANVGNRGIRLDNGEFGVLADVRYHECEWNRFRSGSGRNATRPGTDTTGCSRTRPHVHRRGWDGDT